MLATSYLQRCFVVSSRSNRLLPTARSVTTTTSDNINEREKMIGLNRNILRKDKNKDIRKDERIEEEYEQIRVKGPKKSSELIHKQVYNRSFIEKEHIDYGWSKLNEKSSNAFYQQSDDHININNLNHLNSDALMEIYRNNDDDDNNNNNNNFNNNNNSNNINYNDLTNFYGFSQFSRSATYKAALNLGVHLGKETNFYHQSMGPYIKGVHNNRYVFDLSLTILNLRKIIRLLQSLIMNNCNILFVGTSRNKDLSNLIKIMCIRCNIAYLDSGHAHGSLMDWDNYASSSRGPGKEIIFKSDSNLKKKLYKFKPNQKYNKSKLHRLMQECPDFILSFDRKKNDLLIHEANSLGIPVGCLCDSDDYTRDIQYVIPCNTSSIQSIHFILDMITRGILEVQYKLDTNWWAKKQDYNNNIKLLKQIESEWQANYDPYQSQRQSKSFVPSNNNNNNENNDIKLPILTPGDYNIKDDYGIVPKGGKNIYVNKRGEHLSNPSVPNTNINQSSLTTTSNNNNYNFNNINNNNDNIMDSDEESRIDALSRVEFSRKHEILQKDGIYRQNQLFDDEEENIAPNEIKSTTWFLNKMLEKHAKNRVQMSRQ